MASYTPNLNLYKPDSTDDFGNFREEFNSNMDKIDQGGGDSVSWNQTQLSGDKIAEIDINGTTTNVYSPTYSMWLIDVLDKRFLNHGKLGVGMVDSIDVEKFTPWLEIDENGIPLCVWDDGN